MDLVISGGPFTGGAGGGITNVNISAGTTSNNLSNLIFSNLNGVSFGLNGSTLTASVGAAGGGITNINVSAGTTSQNLSNIVFSNSNNFSFGLNGSTLTGSYTVPTVTNSSWTVSDANTSATVGRLAFTNSNGLTLSLSTSNNGNHTVIGSYTVPGATVFSNSNNVSFGLNGSTITATVTVATSLTNINLSAGTTSNNLSAMVFSNGNGVTFGLNGSTVTASVAAAGGAQTGISGIVVSDTTYTSGTVSFSNQANITIGSSVNGATQYIRLSGNPAQTNQSAIKGFGVSNTGQTAGNTGISTGIDWVLAGSQSITLSQSTVGGGPNTVWFQHPAWLTTAMQSNAATISNINLSAGTTSNNSSAFTFSNANGVSFGLNAGTITASVAAAGGAQTGISGIVVSDTTYTSGTVSFSNAGNITISSSVNGATQYIRLSGNAAQTNQSAIKGFGVSNTGATAGNTGISTGIDWVLAGSNLLTLSQSTAGGGPNTVWIQHPAWLTTAMQSNAATISNINISAGTTNSNLSNFSFADSNRVSFGLNGSTITAKHALNFSAGTTSNNISDGVTFANSNNVSFGLNGSTITASYGPLESYYFNFEPASAALGYGGVLSNSSAGIIPFKLPYHVTFDYLRLPFIGVNTSTSYGTSAVATAYSASLLSTYYAVIYSRGTGASSMSLRSVTSQSVGFTLLHSITETGTQYTISYSVSFPLTGGTSSFSTSTNFSNGSIQMSTGGLSHFTGIRGMDFGFSTSLTPGNYWLLFAVSSTTSTQGTNALTGCNVLGKSLIGNVFAPNSAGGNMGQATSSSAAMILGAGVFSTNQVTTASIPLTAISTMANNPIPFFQLFKDFS